MINDVNYFIVYFQIRVLHHSRIIRVLTRIIPMTASIDNDGGTLIKLIPTFKNEFKKDFNIVSVQIDVPSPNITMIFGFLYDPGGRI